MRSAGAFLTRRHKVVVGLTCRYPVQRAIRPSRACIDECHHAFDVASRPSWTRHHRPGGPRWRPDPGASPGGAHVPRRPSRRDDPHHDWCSSAQVRTRVHRHHARVRCVQPSRRRSWYTRDAAAAARVSLAPEPRPRPATRVRAILTKPKTSTTPNDPPSSPHRSHPSHPNLPHHRS